MFSPKEVVLTDTHSQEDGRVKVKRHLGVWMPNPMHVSQPQFDRLVGTLERTDGTACAFSATFRALVTRQDEFRVLVSDIPSNC